MFTTNISKSPVNYEYPDISRVSLNMYAFLGRKNDWRIFLYDQ